MNMKKKQEILYYLPFILLFLAELIIHWKIDLNIPGGDDAAFLACSQEEGFSLVPWLAERYMTWSSRTAIEAALMLMVNLPASVWRAADSLVVVIGAAALTRLLERRECREYYSFFVSLMFLALPYNYMSLAGWIATSLNYMWPLAFGLVGIYPVRKYIDGERIRVSEGVLCTVCLLFAGSSEQMAFVLLASYGCCGVYLLWGKERKLIWQQYKYYLLQTALIVLCFVYILACPGNGHRSVAETATWLPEFASYSLFTKMKLGVAVTIKAVFVQKNIGFLLMTFLLAVLIWQYRKNWVCRVTALIPAFTMLVFEEIRQLLESDHPLLNLNTLEGIGLIIVCGLVLLNFYVLMGKSPQFLLASGIYAAALATKAVMGFSPTIYASGERTSWIMYVLFLGCVAVLLSKWDFKNRQASILLCMSFLFVSAPGILSNYMVCVGIQ